MVGKIGQGSLKYIDRTFGSIFLYDETPVGRENLNFLPIQSKEQLDMVQPTHELERLHLAHLCLRSHPEQPRHDPWVWFLKWITNQLLIDPF